MAVKNAKNKNGAGVKRSEGTKMTGSSVTRWTIESRSARNRD